MSYRKSEGNCKDFRLKEIAKGTSSKTSTTTQNLFHSNKTVRMTIKGLCGDTNGKKEPEMLG